MEQKYAKRKSIPRNSYPGPINNEKGVIDQNIVNHRISFWQKLAKSWDKYVYTFCILFCYMTYGLCCNVFPPAMVDMKFLFRTSMANINYSYSFGSVGYLVGSFAGFLYKYINRQITFVVALVMLALFTGVEPFCTSVWQVYLAFFLNAVGGGIYDSGNSVWVVEMWGKHSPPVLQLSQSMYGLGSIIGPLIVKPFVYGDLSNKTDDTTGGTTIATVMTTIMSTTSASLNSTSDDDINYSVDRRPKLKIPYMIAGGLTLIVPTILLVMLFIKRYKVPKNRIQEQKDKHDSDQGAINAITSKQIVEVSPTTRKILIGLVAFSLSTYSGLEIIYFNYSSTYYQYLPIHLSAATAATVMAVMTGTYCGGRALSAIISSRLSGETMIMYHCVILCISLATLYFGKNSEIIIYIGNAMIGFGFSAMWPSYFAFSEKYIKLTDKVTSIYSIASALFALTAPFYIGPLIEKHPEVFIDFEIGTLFLTICLFIMIMVIIKRSQRYPILYTINTNAM